MSGEPRLKPLMGLGGLLLYGIVVIQPTAPLGSFGVVSQVAKGHVATTLLIAMVAMIFTAISYGRMANAYPSAGSAFTFVGKGLHPHLGFMAGWCLALDYMLLPTIGTIWCAKAAMNVAPLPYPVYIVGFAAAFTLVNMRGIQTNTRVNIVVAALLLAVLAIFFAAATAFVLHSAGLPGLVSARPFYDPATFDTSSVFTGASVAVLTYMGFDCISTLSEDVRNPRRNIALATVLLCVITGVFGTLQVYFGQLVWPDFASYPDPDTAFVAVAGRAGGPALFQLMNVALLVATIGSSMAAQLGAGRLLYAMGRDRVLPRALFGHLDARRSTPTYNLLLLGTVIAAGGLTLTYQTGAELVNFGAFVAFMGVNAAAFAHSLRQAAGHSVGWKVAHLLPPVLGFLVCLAIWASLRWQAKLAGFAWMAAGVVYLVWLTRGFRRRLELSDPLAASA